MGYDADAAELWRDDGDKPGTEDTGECPEVYDMLEGGVNAGVLCGE
jgi:hypothetical protein